MDEICGFFLTKFLPPNYSGDSQGRGGMFFCAAKTGVYRSLRTVNFLLQQKF